jgi:hypothetical protein
MAPPQRTLSSYNEADILLASSSLDYQQLDSSRRAAFVYNVLKSTLNDRRAGKPARRDCQPNLKKLT